MTEKKYKLFIEKMEVAKNKDFQEAYEAGLTRINYKKYYKNIYDWDKLFYDKIPERIKSRYKLKRDSISTNTIRVILAEICDVSLQKIPSIHYVAQVAIVLEEILYHLDAQLEFDF